MVVWVFWDCFQDNFENILKNVAWLLGWVSFVWVLSWYLRVGGMRLSLAGKLIHKYVHVVWGAPLKKHKILASGF